MAGETPKADEVELQIDLPWSESDSRATRSLQTGMPRHSSKVAKLRSFLGEFALGGFAIRLVFPATLMDFSTRDHTQESVNAPTQDGTQSGSELEWT